VLVVGVWLDSTLRPPRPAAGPPPAYAALRRGLTQLARRRRPQLVAFLFPGMILGGGLVAVMGDFAGGPERHAPDRIHRAVDHAWQYDGDGSRHG
jgi:hypothetical protein